MTFRLLSGTKQPCLSAQCLVLLALVNCQIYTMVVARSEGVCENEDKCQLEESEVLGSSSYHAIVSLANDMFAKVTNFAYKGMKATLDTASRIAWQLWLIFIVSAGKYFPLLLVLVIFFLVGFINWFMWYIRLPYFYILTLDAASFLLYSFLGPEFILLNFPKFVSVSYRLLYALIIDYRMYTAIAILCLPVLSCCIPSCLKASRRSRTERHLLGIEATQRQLMENQEMILQLVQALDKKCPHTAKPK